MQTAAYVCFIIVAVLASPVILCILAAPFLMIADSILEYKQSKQLGDLQEAWFGACLLFVLLGGLFAWLSDTQ